MREITLIRCSAEQIRKRRRKRSPSSLLLECPWWSAQILLILTSSVVFWCWSVLVFPAGYLEYSDRNQDTAADQKRSRLTCRWTIRNLDTVFNSVTGIWTTRIYKCLRTLSTFVLFSLPPLDSLLPQVLLIRWLGPASRSRVVGGEGAVMTV